LSEGSAGGACEGDLGLELTEFVCLGWGWGGVDLDG